MDNIQKINNNMLRKTTYLHIPLKKYRIKNKSTINTHKHI